MTYFSSALSVSSQSPERSLSVAQTFSKYYKRVVAVLRLENEVCVNVILFAKNGTFNVVTQTVDSNNNSIDFDIYGKQIIMLIILGTTIIGYRICK